MNNRISYLDGLRGVAIIMVVLFHAYYRWPDLMPFGNRYQNIPFFEYGFLGVQLFFLISGFVILMTLEKCQGVKDFLYRRWLRLFPAMLICSGIVFFSASLFPERPKGEPGWLDLLPGLTFTEPYWWNKYLNLNVSSLEGAFWSLYVEFKFYILAAIFYFFMGSRCLVAALFLCFLLWVAVEFFLPVEAFWLFSILDSLAFNLSFEYFGWFASGAAYYLYIKEAKKYWLLVGVSISILSVFAESRFVSTALFANFLVASLFFIALVNSYAQKILSHSTLLYVGALSYPLYLLHENMMVAISIKIDGLLTGIPSVVYPLLAMVFVGLMAHVVAKHLEVITKRALKRSIGWVLSQVSLPKVTS